MTRKAILIESSNVKDQTDLPGARADIENWKEFLRSDLGGAWEYPGEIKVLNTPYSGDVEKELKVSSDCYCFVAFSGHGCDGSVVLNEHWTKYAVSKLLPACDKSTVIIDACRGIETAERLRFATATVMLNAARAEKMAVHASHARRGWIMESASTEVPLVAKSINTYYLNWSSALQKSPKGVVQMLACAKGQGAGENPQAGGYYTSLLMQSAIEWNTRQTTETIHSTKNAHDYAASLLPPQQTPEYSPSYLAFPFAAKE